jgi:hypothetical protein
MQPDIMKPLYALLIPFALTFLASCDKDYSYEGGFKPTTPVKPTEPPVIIDTPPPPMSDAERLKALLLSGNFQLKAFYSDIPIDQNTTDNEVKQETDLWPYVAPWLVDDVDAFTENTVTITQNSVKRPLLADPTVIRNYSINTDEDRLYIIFLDYLYDPLTYRVHEIGEDYFILAVPGPQSSTLYSRFERV